MLLEMVPPHFFPQIRIGQRPGPPDAHDATRQDPAEPAEAMELRPR